MSSRIHHLFTAALLSVLVTADLRAQDVADRTVEVVFTPDMNRDDLARIREEVRSKGVDLDIKSRDFNDGALTRIAFIVSTAKGTGSADCVVDAEHHVGFRYDPRSGALAVGTLE